MLPVPICNIIFHLFPILLALAPLSTALPQAPSSAPAVYPVIDAAQRRDRSRPADPLQDAAWNVTAGVIFQRYSPDNDLTKPSNYWLLFYLAATDRKNPTYTSICLASYTRIPSSDLAFSNPRALYAATDAASTQQPSANQFIDLPCIPHDASWQPTPLQFKNIWESYNDTATDASDAVRDGNAKRDWIGGRGGSGSGRASNPPELKVDLTIRKGWEIAFELRDGPRRGKYDLKLDHNGPSCVEVKVADFYDSRDWFGEGFITRVLNCGGGRDIKRVMDRLPTLTGERVAYGRKGDY